MDNRVLYLGDTNLETAASYLAGIMSYCGIGFDYLPSDAKFEDSLLNKDYKAMIISDYPAVNFSESQIHKIADKVKNGMGLLMIGGWGSFSGLGGGYNNTLFAEILPVKMSKGDDRINTYSVCVVENNAVHEIVQSLPFEGNPPTIAGYNLLDAKKSSQTILSVKRFSISKTGGEFYFNCKDIAPLLVVDSFGRGKVAAFASDVAPHWTGGLVDWGDKRMAVKAKGAGQVEIGNWYLSLFGNMINWVMNKN